MISGDRLTEGHLFSKSVKLNGEMVEFIPRKTVRHKDFILTAVADPTNKYICRGTVADDIKYTLSITNSTFVCVTWYGEWCGGDIYISRRTFGLSDEDRESEC